MRIDSAIITGSFSVNGDTFNDLGAYTTTGSNTFVGNQCIIGAVSASALTGSISYTNLTDVPTLVSGSSQIVSILSPLNLFTASNSTTNTFTSSATARLNSIETITASNVARLNSIETITSSNIARLNSIETITSSNIARLNSLEAKTGSLATTGSNTFIGDQIISGTVYIQNNLVVQGSSSLQNITASAVSIGTNTVVLNTANPSVRFGGLSVVDSGSAAGKSGSLYFDSRDDEWIFVHQGNTAVTSSIVITGPETYDSLGNETRLTTNSIPKIQSGFHIVDSCIFDNGTTTCIKNNLVGTGTISGTTTYSSTISCSPIGCFGIVCSPSFIGGTISGTNVYASTVSCSPVGCFGILCGDSIYTSYISPGGQTSIRGVGNKLGIGTANPLGVLSITGGQNSLASLATYSSIEPLGIFNMFYTNSGTYPFYLDIVSYGDPQGTTGGSNIRFLTNCSNVGSMPVERMRITNCGNVGIGTSTPNDILDVQKNQNATTNIYFRNTDNTNASSRLYLNLIAGNASAGLAVLAGGLNCGALYVGGVAGGCMYFQPSLGGTVSATITSAGCFGIGTTAPESTLHINGNNGGGYAASITLVNCNNTAGTSTGIDFGVDNSTAGGGTGNAQIKVINIGGTTGVHCSDMIFSLWNGASFNERLKLISNGNVCIPGNLGLGLVPGSKLSVNGNISLGTSANYNFAGPSQYGGITLPRGEFFFSNTNPQNQLYLTSNGYNNSNGVFAYRNNGCAASIGLDNGGISFLTGPNGTADAAVGWNTPLAIANAGTITIGGGNLVNSSNNKAHTFCQLNSGNFSTKNFTYSGTSNGSFAVTDFSGIPSNAKAVQVYGWYHITGYGNGAGQGDHAMSWFGPATLNTTTQWGSNAAGWPNGEGSYTPRFHGTFVMEHDGDASGTGLTNYMHYYGSWHQGTINVHTDGNIYYSLGAGISGGTHYNALIATGYWI